MSETNVEGRSGAGSSSALGRGEDRAPQNVATFRTRGAPHSASLAKSRNRARALRTAVAHALGFGALAVAVHVSYWALTSDAVHSFEELSRLAALERLGLAGAGCAFVLVVVLRAERRADRDARELERRGRALLGADGRALAGRIAASIAHDANNVLCALSGDLELHAMPAETVHAARLQSSVERLVALNRRLIDCGQHSERPEFRPTDLAIVVRESVATLRSHPCLRTCRIAVSGAGEFPLNTDAVLWHQIVCNLVLNAGEATGGRGAIEVRVERCGPETALEVHDDGPGVPRERREGLFEACESTKRAAGGLGLFSVQTCAGLLGGRVEVGDSALGGALFRVLVRSTGS